MVLYRYGSTGTLDTVRRIVDLLGMIPVYPVKSIHNFTSDGGANRTGKVFRDCLLVRPGTTIRDLLELLPGDMSTYYNGAETVGAIQVRRRECARAVRHVCAHICYLLLGAGGRAGAAAAGRERCDYTREQHYRDQAVPQPRPRLRAVCTKRCTEFMQVSCRMQGVCQSSRSNFVQYAGCASV